MPAACLLDKKETLEAIKKYKGKIALVALSLKVSVGTVYNFANRHKIIKKAIKNAQKDWDITLVDTAEAKLFKAVTNGKAWAIRFVLETKGRDRGYSTKNEIEVQKDSNNSGPIKIEIVGIDHAEIKK